MSLPRHTTARLLRIAQVRLGQVERGEVNRLGREAMQKFADAEEKKLALPKLTAAQEKELLAARVTYGKRRKN